MKKVAVVLTIFAVIVVSAAAFAHGPGSGRGYGYGECGGPGSCYGSGAADSKFLDETADVRKELHAKKFEYMEMVRKPDADEKAVAELEKEIDDLREKILDKAPKDTYGKGWRRYGRFGQGYGCRW